MKAAAAGLLLAATTALGARAEPCWLALALALDISHSVNEQEYAIQRDGLAAALRDPQIVEAVLEAPGPVWIAAYEWSGLGRQSRMAEWTLASDVAALDALSARIAGHARTDEGSPTALGAAAAFGARLFAELPTPCARRVIDISGDGVNNQGPSATAYRGDPIFAGLTINGLVIKGATPDPEPHYREEVLWGPGAFLVVARNGFDDYSDLILGKLLRELKPPLFVGTVAGERAFP